MYSYLFSKKKKKLNQSFELMAPFGPTSYLFFLSDSRRIGTLVALGNVFHFHSKSIC